MICKLCQKQIEYGRAYAYARTGSMCLECALQRGWFVPDFAVGYYGTYPSIMEQTNTELEPELDLLTLYFG